MIEKNILQKWKTILLKGKNILRIVLIQQTKMIKVLTAWKAVRSEATITGDAVLGGDSCNDSAWKAVRLW